MCAIDIILKLITGIITGLKTNGSRFIESVETDYNNIGILDTTEIWDLRSIKKEVIQVKEKLHPPNIDEIMVILPVID